MSDALLFAGCFLACWLAAGAAVAVLINRARNRRPYLAAHFDDTAGDWLDEEPHDAGERSDMSLADLDLCKRLWDLPAHGTDNHTTNPTGDQT